MSAITELWNVLKGDAGPAVPQAAGESELNITSAALSEINDMLINAGIQKLSDEIPLSDNNAKLLTGCGIREMITKQIRFNAGCPLSRFGDPTGVHPNLGIAIEHVMNEGIIDLPPMIFDVTRVLDWTNGTFRIGSSCWWTSGGARGASRQMLVLGGGFALRTFAQHGTLKKISDDSASKNAWHIRFNNAKVEPRGRSWIYPVGYKGAVIFNTYDSHGGRVNHNVTMTDYSVAKLICNTMRNRTGEKWDYGEIEYLHEVGGEDSGGMYINNGSGVMVFKVGSGVRIPTTYTLEGTMLWDEDLLVDSFTGNRWTESEWLEIPGWEYWVPNNARYDRPYNFYTSDTQVTTVNGMKLPKGMCIEIEENKWMHMIDVPKHYHYENGTLVPGATRIEGRPKSLSDMELSYYVSKTKGMGFRKKGMLADALSDPVNHARIAANLCSTVGEFYSLLKVMIENNQIQTIGESND